MTQDLGAVRSTERTSVQHLGCLVQGALDPQGLEKPGTQGRRQPQGF